MSDPHLPPALQRVSPETALALPRSYELQLGNDAPGEGQDDALSLKDLLRIVIKHKWKLLAIILLACGMAAVRTLLSTPVYRASSTLQFLMTTQRVVEFNQTDTEQPTWDETSILKTQYELLKSRSLAERVIDELRLDQVSKSAKANEGLDKKADQDDGWMSRVVSGYRTMTTPATKDKQQLSREGSISAFLQSVTVEPIRNSRLVRVHVENTNPELAARIANTLVQTFIAMGLERRLESSVYAKNFLEDQIKQVKAKLEDSERKLNQYAQTKQLLTLDEKTNVIGQTYTEYATALAKAEQDRIKAEAAYEEIKRNPDNAPQVLDNKTVQSYKEAKAKLEIEYQQNLGIYKADFPKMVQLRGQIDKAEGQVKAETAAVTSALLSQFKAAQQQENLIRQKVAETKRAVFTTQDSSIDMNLLKREVDTNRQLYDGLLQRLKQVNVVGGLTANNVSVVDRADPPLFPFKPDLKTNMAIGLAIGVVLGLCMVFLLEYLDDSIKLPEEVERTLGVPLMGIVPFVGKRKDVEGAVALDVHSSPRSPVAEAYRSLRTALQFSTSEGAPRRLVVTSTTRDEGKSTTALSLAINFAQMGHRVLLVDADMRNPSVHKQLGIHNDMGLSNLLSGDYGAETLIHETPVPNLSVMCAGPIPPNPVELLMGPKLATLVDTATVQGAHFVIVDAPPLLGIADSVVLGNQLQNILFVVQAGRTRKSHIRDALRRLRLAGLVPRGIVLTQVQKAAGHHHYESYYGYGYGRDQQQDERAARRPA